MMGESSARFRQFHDAARTATMRDASGIGLADIEERARALGGTAVCGPYHEGWRVFVSIPQNGDDRGSVRNNEGERMMRVAIVDDDPIVCSSLSTILKATGRPILHGRPMMAKPR